MIFTSFFEFQWRIGPSESRGLGAFWKPCLGFFCSHCRCGRNDSLSSCGTKGASVGM